MEQITISKKLFNRMSNQNLALLAVFIAFITFLWDIYTDCNESGVTLSSINIALAKSVILGVCFYGINFFLFKKYKQKLEQKEITALQKYCSVIILCGGILIMFGAVLYANHLKIAPFVLWFGTLSIVVSIAVALIFRKKILN
jgi:hypothetical protein